MLTDKGREIIGKFMISQIPAWATHVAIGCGATPIGVGENQPAEDQQRTRLEFEMARVPIIARGYVNDPISGETKLFLKAELPAAYRYRITEVGLYPANANKLAGRYDSKQLATFLPAENWYYGNDGVLLYTSKIDGTAEVNIALDNGSGGEYSAVYVSDDNAGWNNYYRVDRLESPRYLGESILIRGNTADIAADGTLNSGTALKTLAAATDFSKNAPTDIIKLAISLVPRTNSDGTKPDEVRFLVDFLNDYSNSTTYTRYFGKMAAIAEGEPYYQIVEAELQDFIASDSAFSWANVNGIRIYTCVSVSDTPSDAYYVMYDGMRLETASDNNPLYGLIGYNVIRAEQPILKRDNSTNYVEYRMGVVTND